VGAQNFLGNIFGQNGKKQRADTRPAPTQATDNRPLASLTICAYSLVIMKEYNEKIPTPKELEKELGDFLSKKFGGNVKVATPILMQQENPDDSTEKSAPEKHEIKFDLKPEDLVAYLDQYIVKQDNAKAILSTKICTHFNRIKRYQSSPEQMGEMVGSIKNNVLMVGPTGVGKTYMIKLIAKKIGVPFVKGDATKFSETGYVGGDVEDLVRDLVREADDDIENAQYGIVYIDEIDKIASSNNLMGADVSRTGVQRALLKPMEETEVDLKVPHDPISMLQEVERFRKTGKREKSTVNTKNILFIMSGAFTGLVDIIHKRITAKGIGFGASLPTSTDNVDVLTQIKSEDLISFGFESEFVGRLPVRAVFERLMEDDLYSILKNPNNPIILGKKLDFAAYDIDAKFEDEALRVLSRNAYEENTGARGLVSAVENALLLFEKKLPSTAVRKFAITRDVIDAPEKGLKSILDDSKQPDQDKAFERLTEKEKQSLVAYIDANLNNIINKLKIDLTPSRKELIAECYATSPTDVGSILNKIKSYHNQVKAIELYFLKNHDINIVLEEDAIDLIIQKVLQGRIQLKDVYKKLSYDFEHGLKLVRDKTGRNRFFITREALTSPEKYVGDLINAHAKSQVEKS
jgi:ATP-dependent Clp protease ATP-binding subunit ClpX